MDRKQAAAWMAGAQKRLDRLQAEAARASSPPDQKYHLPCAWDLAYASWLTRAAAAKLERARAAWEAACVAEEHAVGVGVAGDRCEPGNECGRVGCEECQQ